MEKLKEQYISSSKKTVGLRFYQLDRTEDHALYKAFTSTQGGSTHVYEVIKIIKRKEAVSIIEGREVHFKAKEAYPQNETFRGDCRCFGGKHKVEDALKYWQELTGRNPFDVTAQSDVLVPKKDENISRNAKNASSNQGDLLPGPEAGLEFVNTENGIQFEK